MVIVSATKRLIIAGALLAGLTLAACQATGDGTFCDIASPIRLSDQAIAAMSDAEVRKALADNRKGERLCGWKA